MATKKEREQTKARQDSFVQRQKDKGYTPRKYYATAEQHERLKKYLKGIQRGDE